jgi:hypothetical protein
VEGDDVVAPALEPLHEVADVAPVEVVGQRGEGDQVGEADGHRRGVQVLVLGAERLHPGHRGREVAAPGVDQQLLEGRVDVADQPQGGAGPGAGRLLARLELLDPGQQGGDHPVGEPCLGLAHRTGQVDGRVEVDGPAVDDALDAADRVDVGLVEGHLADDLREAERAPEPTRPVDVDVGLGGDLQGGEVRLLTEDRLVEPLGPLAVRRHRRARPRPAAVRGRSRADHVTRLRARAPRLRR